MAQALAASKAIVRPAGERARLESVNAAECALLRQRWLSPEVAQAVADFFARKAKL